VSGVKATETRRGTHLDLVIIIEWQGGDLQKTGDKDFSARMNEYPGQVFTQRARLILQQGSSFASIMASSAIQAPDLSQLIAELVSTSEAATDALLLPHNKRYLAPSPPPRTVKQQRQITPALETRPPARITLSLDRLPNNQSLGFVFGSDRETCDVLLHNEPSGGGISRKHFRITINTDTGVLIVNDESTHGTVVTSRRFGELMLRKASTPIFAHDDIQAGLVTFRLLIPSRESCQDDFERNWKSYCSERNAARAKSLEQPAHQYQAPQTSLETEKLTLMNQFYQRSGKTVSKAVDYRGNFYAVKQLGKHIHRENRYLKGINHVRSPQIIDHTRLY